MRRFTLAAALATGIWWALLLPGWVSTSGTEVAGTELNRTLALVPGIVLLLALISLYGKLSRALLIAAGTAVIGSVFWVVTSDLESAPKVIELQELATGLAGGNGDAVVGYMPWVFASFGILTALLLTLAALSRPTKRAAVDSRPTDSDDPRFIWDEQSN